MGEVCMMDVAHDWNSLPAFIKKFPVVVEP
jgi:hypothetical protein